ncbi:MAG TPA: MXAN_2562 family outer membrane beta-barrel protein [Myxococcota bacterium]|nr:MXAN_2562 family outer membrane beta-barrel protein [Myxococcota bacterium]
MNIRIFSAAVVLVIVGGFVPSPASAEEEPKKHESPRRFFLEAKFSPYRPAIDSEFGNATPFKDVFGGGQFLMTQVEFEYEIWNKVGIIGIGAVLGYSRLVGTGINPVTLEEATDKTAMNVMPLAIHMLYKFDYLAQRYKVPLVPHVKAGFDYWIWWIENGTGDVASVPGSSEGSVRKGYGGTWGGHVSLGIAFLLDFIAPSMAQTFDVDVGVNNSYLFFEYTWAWINDFGVGNSMNLSAGMFVGGIAFEF